MVQKLSVQIEEERNRLAGTKYEGDMLFKRYTILDDYTCKDKKVTLRKGSVVEILDTEREDMWLVRLAKDKHQVSYKFISKHTRTKILFKSNACRRAIHSFIPLENLYSAPSRNLLRGTLSLTTVKSISFKQLVDLRHVALW